MRVCRSNGSYRTYAYGWFLAVVLSLSLQASMQAQAVLSASEAVDGASAGTNSSGDMATIAPGPEKTGDSLASKGRYLAAVQAYAQIAHPSAVLWNKMGIAYQMVYDLKDATHCYKESLKLQPANAWVLNNFGTVQDLQGDFQAAERDYRKSLKLEPDNAHVLRNLGTNLLMQREYDKSAEVYQQALAIDPHVLDPHYNLQVEVPGGGQTPGAANYIKARSCARAGLTDCALTYLEQALNEGSTTAKKVAADADFASLRGTPAMERLLARQQ
jgi:Tfp pilus assembly protein PilF